MKIGLRLLPFLLLILLAEATVAASHRLLPWQAKIFSEVEKIYSPLIMKQNASFSIEIDEASNSLTGSATLEKNHLKVILDRGLLNSPRLSPDGLRTLICHEIGHLLGGAPRRNIPFDWDGDIAPDGLSFMSSEGQADYYASLVCFRQLVKGQDHSLNIENKKLSSRVSKLCDEAHVNLEDSQICQRAAYGGLDMLQISSDFSISFDRPNSSVAAKLVQDSYPERQCRLDTYLAGALCRKSSPDILDFTDSSQNDCDQAEAKRPRCWLP